MQRSSSLLFYAYILFGPSLSLSWRGRKRWKLNRNATRVLTFYSPETIDRYRYGKYIIARRSQVSLSLSFSLLELLRLIHTSPRHYPAGFPRLIRKLLENRIALFHPVRRPIPFPFSFAERSIARYLLENSGGLAVRKQSRSICGSAATARRIRNRVTICKMYLSLEHFS